METGRLVNPQPRRRVNPGQIAFKRLLQPLFWGLTLLLLAWAFRQFPLAAIGQIVGGLAWWQILTLIIVNTGIVLLMGGRWWLILRAQGYPIPYLAIVRYRLAAFAVSYFTPGPHFGGEPLQVYYLQKNHQVPGPTALAALSLDKLLELVANFGFLVFGIASIVVMGILGGAARDQTLWAAITLLALPLIYLFLLGSGRTPLTRLMAGLSRRGGRWQEIFDWAQASESQVSRFLRQQPKIVMLAALLSLVVWLALGFEYWLALRFLGQALGFWATIAVITAARLAMLTPMPGALGALEAGQVFAMQTLGLDPAFGLSVSLVIRGRDVAFGLLGLWLGSRS